MDAFIRGDVSCENIDRHAGFDLSPTFGKIIRAGWYKANLRGGRGHQSLKYHRLQIADARRRSILEMLVAGIDSLNTGTIGRPK